MALTQKQRVLLDELLARDEDVKVIPWPARPATKIGMRLLSDAEMAEADAAAREWASAQGLDTTARRHADTEFSARYAAEVLMRALIHPETRQPVVADADGLRKRVTRMELNALLQAYNDYAQDMFGDPKALTEDEMAEIVERLRSPFGRDQLLSFAPSTLRALLLYMASRLPASTG